MLAVLAVIALTLAFASSALAGQGPGIAGTVTSAVTKAPIEGVEVCEYPDEGGAGNRCAQTDSKGEYVLEVGRAGTFVVHFDTAVEGLIPQTFYKGVFVNREATRVQVAEGETMSGIDEAIEEGGRIAGRVLDSSTKAPIEGVEACAELPDVDQSGVEPHRTCATTNAGGEYEIQGLTPGEGVPEGGYEVEFADALDYIGQFYDGKSEPERYSGTRIPIHAGQTVANIDAELEAGGEISGRVTSQVNGQPIAGVRACAGDEAFPSYCAETNAAGEYTITRLPSHEYTVHFGGLETEYLDQYYEEKEWPDVERVSVTAPQKVSGIDASLKAYGRIAGTVIDKTTRQPIRGVNVCLAGGDCENTNAAGEYSFSKLLAGTYALDFYAGRLNEETGDNYLSQYEANEYIVQEKLKTRNPQAAHVAVTMGGKAVIDDELEEGGRISGTMLEAGTEKPASLWPCAEDLSTGHPESAKVCPGSMSGNTYTISGLPPGRYRVVFGASLPAYYFTQYYDDRDLRSEAQEVLVESGKTTGQIDADLIANSHPWEGAIAGTVKGASGTVLEGVEVCAYQKGSEELFGECAITNANGEYLLEGLPNGEYDLEFFPSPASGLNYLTQYYDGKTSFTGAQPVTVVWGSITPGIDAQLQEGGQITGDVTDTSTETALRDVLVCALTKAEEVEGCAITNSSGEYKIAALPGGEYEIGFDGGKNYITQYYNDKLSFSEAQAVPVTIGKTTASIDAAMGSSDAIPPANTKSPVISGTAALGETLLCADGLWTGSPTPSLTDRWLRDGVPIQGATAGSYIVQAADEGHSLSCEVEGTSTAGKGSAISAAVTIPGGSSVPTSVTSSAGPTTTTTTTLAPDLTGSLPHVSIVPSTIVVSGSSVPVHFNCSGATCRGSLELTMQLLIKRHQGKKTVFHRETLVLATGSFSLAEGDHATAVLRLTAAGRQRLAQAKHHPIAAALICSVQGGKTITKAVMAS